MSSLDDIHNNTAKMIADGERGFAQMTLKRNGQKVSWHQGIFGDDTFTGVVPNNWGVAEVRAAFIDQWSTGEAKVSPCTFTNRQIERRASQWRYGNGPLITPGDDDKKAAEDIMKLLEINTANGC